MQPVIRLLTPDVHKGGIWIGVKIIMKIASNAKAGMYKGGSERSNLFVAKGSREKKINVNFTMYLICSECRGCSVQVQRSIGTPQVLN